AEPYHEVITNWQREFQQEIGKNHARYFDQNGWLYFTKERFDLLYPSYGDTYPIYNGSIGMTYEQGGIRAGVGIMNEDGDTLTLRARVAHHLTTSLSTIELSSLHQKKLVSEFSQFFENAISKGIGTYKSFVIKAESKKQEHLNQLLSLLDAHGIQYAVGASGSAKGINFYTGKEESFSLSKEDVVVTGYQPNSALLQVLFEPRTSLSDSATYDITAWSLPYAYGLQAFASKDRIIAAEPYKRSPLTIENTQYGYALPWNSLKSAVFASRLLQAGYKLRYAVESFAVNGKSFDPGTILVLKTSNEKFGERLFDTIREWALQDQVNLVSLKTGLVDKGADFGSDKVVSIRTPRVALLTGEGSSSLSVGEIWNFFDRQLSYPITLLNNSSFSTADLASFDVLILPEGRFRFLDAKENVEGLRAWLQNGGKLIAIGESSKQLTKLDIGLISRKTDADSDKDAYASLHLFKDREREEIGSLTTGSIWKVMLDVSHPIAFGYPAAYYTLKTDPTLFEFLKKDTGWNVGVLKKDVALAGFVGSQLDPKLKDGVLIGQIPVGGGSVSFFADNILFRNFWENGKLFLCNALFF
ncbi:MAG: zinc carboxypeptidase, partial [Chitinophagaceae bacterium]|nr:zinc carboxypeptidase [Chitinophagaceae bacterium]